MALWLVASAVEASAAWVLWEQQRTWRQNTPAMDVWDIVEAFETKADCETARSGFNDPWTSSDNMPQSFTAIRHVCYPDTIDPRRQNSK